MVSVVKISKKPQHIPLTNNTLITTDTTNLTYLSDKFQLQLLGDLNEDIYKLVVSEY